jgi:tape measure domain-containing protein
MTFDNAKFERDIATSIKSLDQLKHAMDFKNVSKTFGELSKASTLKMTVDTSQFTRSMAQATGDAKSLQNNLNFGATGKSFGEFAQQVKGFNLEGMATSIGGVSKKFLALATIGITALAQIASQAVRTGIDMATSLTTDPIIQGFREMETNMNSIQTILANTSKQGTTLEQVNAALNQLNEYSDKTIYNFAQMARNVGTFTTAGIDLDTSVGAIKGISNLAALSGSSAEQAATGMYQLSQALSAGVVRLKDWISVENAGFGGRIFQEQLFETGKALGKFGDIPMDMTFDEWEKSGVRFRESLEQDWLTADVLTTVLQGFTGDLTEAQLVALGYTEEQATELARLGKLASDSATEVKTLTQLLGTVKESIGSGWSRSFQLIFGDFNEAKATFTDFNNIIGEWVGKNADARNKVLSDWKALGGRTLIIEKIKDLFSNLNKIIDQVQFAFHDIFPRMTGERLFELTEKFGEFVDKLDLGRAGLDRVARYASAFFTSIDIGLQIVKRFGEFVGDLFQYFTGGGGAENALNFFDKIARYIQHLYNTLVAGGGIDAFFDSLTEKITNFVDAFKADPSGKIKEIAGNLGSALGQLFDSLLFGNFHGGYLAEDSPIVSFIFNVRDKIKEGMSQIGEVLAPMQEFINGLLGTNFDIHIPDAIKNLFTSFAENVDGNTSNSLAGGFDRVRGYVDKIQEGLQKAKDVTSTMWDVVKKMGDAFQWIWNTGRTVFDVISDVLGDIWDFAKKIGPTLQDAFMSEEFDQFLNLLDSLGILLGGRGLQQFGANNANLGANFGANLGANFGGKGLEALTKGGGLIDALKTNMSTLTDTLKTMQTQIKANALLDIAKALAVLTASVLVLSFINPESLAKSLTALAVGMGQLLGAVALLNISSGKGGLTPGLGLIGITVAMNAISTAILILSAALAVLAQLSPSDLANGLLTIETLIIEMATAALLLKGGGPNLIAVGLGMIAIAGAVTILAAAMKIFATMSWEEIGKGLVSVAGGLLIIAGAMQLMPVASILIGPALIAVAFALNLLAAALVIFATLSWEEIGKGMTALAGGLLIIAGALQLMPLTSIISGPALIAVATALTILAGVLKIFATMSWEEIGKAMTVLGGSLLILAGGLALMQGAIPGAIALGIASGSLLLLGKALKGFADMNWKQLAKGLAIMAISLGTLALASLAIQGAIPAMLLLSVALLALGAGFALVGVGAALLAEAFQIIAAAGTAGIDVLMYAVDQFLSRIPELIKVFTDGLLLIVQSIIDSLPAMVTGLGKIIAALLKVIIDNIPAATEVVTKLILSILQVIRDASPDFVKTGFKLILDFLHGIEDNVTEIVDTVATIIARFLRELTRHVPELVDAGNDLLVALLEGIALHLPELITAGVDVLQGLLDGIIQNIDDIAGTVGDLITRFIEEVGKLYGRIATAGAEAFIEFLDGMGENAQDIIKACARLVGDILDGLLTAALILANRMLDVLIALMDGLTEAIDSHDEEINRAAYDLAWAIVQGIVTAVGAQKIIDALWNIGKNLASKIKDGFMNALGIRSPSRVFMEISAFIPEGIVKALETDKSSEAAGRDLADRTIQSFRDSVRAMAYSLENTEEFNPTITPVMDLTQVKATAGQIGSLLGTDPLTAGVSVGQANAIGDAAQAKAEADAAESEKPTEIKEVKFEQNNYSPEMLNTARVYRQTRSLIRVTQDELEKV